MQPPLNPRHSPQGRSQRSVRRWRLRPRPGWSGVCQAQAAAAPSRPAREAIGGDLICCSSGLHQWPALALLEVSCSRRPTKFRKHYYSRAETPRPFPSPSARCRGPSPLFASIASPGRHRPGRTCPWPGRRTHAAAAVRRTRRVRLTQRRSPQPPQPPQPPRPDELAVSVTSD